MSTEFANAWKDSYDTVDHLHKVQLARCREFLLYVEKLDIKYQQGGRAWWDRWDSLMQRNHLSARNGYEWVANRFKGASIEQTIINVPEQCKYLAKLKRVVDAKFDFELFKGEYENYA